MLLVFGAPCQHSLLAGREHGRTIPSDNLLCGNNWGGPCRPLPIALPTNRSDSRRYLGFGKVHEGSKGRGASVPRAKRKPAGALTSTGLDCRLSCSVRGTRPQFLDLAAAVSPEQLREDSAQSNRTSDSTTARVCATVKRGLRKAVLRNAVGEALVS